MIGAYPMYIIGRILSGKNIYAWLEGKGKFLQIDKKKFDQSKKRISQQSYTYIFLSRFVPYLRIVVSLASGFLETNFFLFSLSTLAGTYVYSAVIAYFGYEVGGDLETIKMYMSKFNTWITPIVLVYIVGSIILKYKKEIKELVKSSKSKTEKNKNPIH
jgi:membrane protein DedA with SNARE-associated domain